MNHARRDLCGGHPVMGVPTAIGFGSDSTKRNVQNSITAAESCCPGTAALWWTFSLFHDVLLLSVPRGERARLAYVDFRFVCGPLIVHTPGYESPF
jgi:hypothetical protein